VRNIAAAPTVRVKARGAWRAGTATLLPDDDTDARSRALPYQWDAEVGRIVATTSLGGSAPRCSSLAARRYPAQPLTIRIDLDAGA